MDLEINSVSRKTVVNLINSLFKITQQLLTDGDLETNLAKLSNSNYFRSNIHNIDRIKKEIEKKFEEINESYALAVNLVEKLVDNEQNPKKEVLEDEPDRIDMQE